MDVSGLTKKISLLFLLFLFFFPTKTLAFGVTPSHVEITDLYRGEKITQVINITSQENERSIISSYSLSVEGDGKQFVQIENNTVSHSSSTVLLSFPLTINTAGAELREYQPKIVVRPNFIDAGGVVSVGLALPVRLVFTVTNEKKSLLEIKNASITSLGQSQELRVTVLNKGNIREGIKKISLGFVPMNSQKLPSFSFDVPVNLASTTDPGEMVKYMFPFEYDISSGNYAVHAIIEDSAGKKYETNFIYSLNGVLGQKKDVRNLIYFIAGVIIFGAFYLTYALYKKKI